MSRLNGIEHDELYKLAHKGHPVVKWTALGYDHYMYGYNYFMAIAAEYERRYQRSHASYDKLRDVLHELSRHMPQSKVASYPVCANGTSYVSHDEAIDLYRRYYASSKQDIATWDRGRDAPDWWIDYQLQYYMRTTA